MFLTDEAIERLLYSHPPTTLDNYFRTANKSLPPARTRLALTRFTENAVWQYTYLQLLNQTTEQDYAWRLPNYEELSEEVFAPVIAIHNHKIKPWRLSHSKETGVVFHFIPKEGVALNKTPNLLPTAVLLHYIFEVHHFGLHVTNRIRAGLPLTAEQIILRKTPILPFLTDGNAHDETLYWRKAWEYLSKTLFPKLLESNDWQTSLFENNESPNSLHPIDILWDVNEIYPGKQNLYHLQQEAWLRLLEQISPLSGIEFENEVLSSLTVNNLQFAESCCH